MAIIWKMPKFDMKIKFFSLLIVPVADKFFLLHWWRLPSLCWKITPNLGNLTFSLIVKLLISITLSLPEYYLDLETLTVHILSIFCLFVKYESRLWEYWWYLGRVQILIALCKWFEFSPDIFLTKLNQDGDLSNLVICLIYHKMFVLLCKISFSTCTSTMIHLVPLPPPPRPRQGRLQYSAQMKNKGYAEFGGTNKVYNGRCTNGEYCTYLLARVPPFLQIPLFNLMCKIRFDCSWRTVRLSSKK